MARAEIGKIPCQCCGEPASVREQKNGRAYVMCNSPVCGYQGFTRSNDADRSLRSRMTSTAPAPAAKPAEPAPAEQNPQPKPKPKKGFFDDLI